MYAYLVNNVNISGRVIKRECMIISSYYFKMK